MANVVVASLNVSFSSDSSADSGANLKLEIDDREDGLNGGNTSFGPGDTAYFFLFKDDAVTLVTTTPRTSAGGITSEGSGTKKVDDYETFSNSSSSSLNYPPNGAVSMQWIGVCYSLVGTTLTINTDLPVCNGSSLKMANNKNVIGVLRCQYNTTGSLWRLSNVPTDIPEVVIFAVGTTS